MKQCSYCGELDDLQEHSELHIELCGLCSKAADMEVQESDQGYNEWLDGVEFRQLCRESNFSASMKFN